MKKNIVTIFLWIILLIDPSFAAENAFLFRNSFYVYDINTFLYDKDTNKYSIDVYYDINNNKIYKKTIKSKYGDNQIQYIIFNVEYFPEKKIINTSYKGFVTGTWILNGNTYLFDKAKIHYIYQNNINKYYNKCAKKFKKYALEAKYTYYMDFNKDIIEIHNAYKNKTIKNWDEVEKTLNTANN